MIDFQRQTPAWELARWMRGLRLPVTTERAMQDAIEAALAGAGIPYQREARLGPEDRIDFLVDGRIGIEAKTRYPRRRIFRQLERYCENNQFDALILITGTYLGLPSRVNGIPLYLVSTGRAAL